MRLIHTADWHLGKSLEGRSRLEEQQAFLDEFVEITEREKADLVIIAGDIYDHVNPSSAAETMFYETLKRLSPKGERMILVIAGNHDHPQRLTAAGPLAREHGILMCGLPKTVIEPGTYGDNRVVDSGEGYVEVEIHGEHAVILTLPYPSEKRLNEVLYAGTEEDTDQALSYEERIRSWFHSLEEHYREDTVNLCVSHLFTMGSKESGSERGIALGSSYLIPADCLPEQSQYTALGHVHRPQVVPGSGHHAWYAGAPMPYHKKEAVPKDAMAPKRLIYSVDVHPQKEAEVREIPLSCYRPVEQWLCRSASEALELCKKEPDTNRWIYLEIETDRWIGEDDIREMKEHQPGILEIHPVLLGSRQKKEDYERAEEKPLDVLFTEFFMSEKGVAPDAELVELLMEIAGEEA